MSFEQQPSNEGEIVDITNMDLPEGPETPKGPVLDLTNAPEQVEGELEPEDSGATIDNEILEGEVVEKPTTDTETFM